MFGITRRHLLGAAVAAGTVSVMRRGSAHAAETTRPAVTIGVLKFGTVNWEMQTAIDHGFDQAAGIDLKPTQLAGNPATQIALMSGAVDMIVTDWLWVAGQRRAGADLTFVPYSTAVGAVMLPPGSTIATPADLKGRRIGVAGSPIDKSWLLLRAHLRDVAGFDPAADASPVFAAPALLNEKLMSGELDAVLNFWHYAARLEARGCRRLIAVEDLIAKMAGTADVPAIGYVFHEAWAKANEEALRGMLAATGKAKTLLAGNDDAWDALKPLMRAEDGATFVALRDGHRRGIPRHWGAAEREGAARIAAAIAAETGKPDEATLPPGTFWDGVAY